MTNTSMAQIARVRNEPRRRNLLTLRILLLILFTNNPSHVPAQEERIPKSVLKIALASTVRIDTSGSPGSGIVIKNAPMNCQVLTAFHVVKQTANGEKGAIIFNNEKTLEYDINSYFQIGSSDLAILSLGYQCPVQHSALLGNPNDIKVGDRVFISGFSSNLSPEVISPSYRVSAGHILSLTEQRDGYSLTYDASTFSGMSGGGIFSSSGTLIGIHGRGETLGQSGVKAAAMGMSVQLLSNAIQSLPDRQSAPTTSPGKACPGVIC